MAGSFAAEIFVKGTLNASTNSMKDFLGSSDPSLHTILAITPPLSHPLRAGCAREAQKPALHGGIFPAAAGVTARANQATPQILRDLAPVPEAGNAQAQSLAIIAFL